MLILPGIAGALLPDSWDTLLQYLPTQAAASFTVVGSTSGAPSVRWPERSFLQIGDWVIVAMMGAVVSIIKRDV